MVRSRTPRRVSTLFAMLAVLALLVAACGADGEDTTAEDDGGEGDTAAGDDPEDAADADGDAADTDEDGAEGVQEPLASGFPDDTITVLVVDDPGSYDALFARDVVGAIEDQSPVDINIVVRDDFGRFGNHAAMQWASEQPGGEDGHVLVVTKEPGGVTDLIGEPIVEELGADLDWFNYVVAVERVPYAIHSPTDRPWGSDLEAMIEWAQDNPGEIRYLGAGGGSGRDITIAALAQAVDFEYEELVGGGMEENGAAIAAGEADFAIANTQTIHQFYEDGRIEILGATQPGEPVEDQDNAPRIHEVFGLEPDYWGDYTGFSVPHMVPDEHREWLAELFDVAGQDPDFVEQRERPVPGLEILDDFFHDEFREVAEWGYCNARPALDAAGRVAPGAEESLIDCSAFEWGAAE